MKIKFYILDPGFLLLFKDKTVIREALSTFIFAPCVTVYIIHFLLSFAPTIIVYLKCIEIIYDCVHIMVLIFIAVITKIVSKNEHRLYFQVLLHYMLSPNNVLLDVS